MAKTDAAADKPASTDFYILLIDVCDRSGQSEELQTSALQKVASACDDVKFHPFEHTAGFAQRDRYELPSGKVNPINPNDDEWDGKLSITKPKQDKDGELHLTSEDFRLEGNS
ncbi:hypothetical protein LTR17_004844 [Elasticomyces elasticus]|nr:hypothetical protein LTR17_004844 [Elasticomyces elasticus]